MANKSIKCSTLLVMEECKFNSQDKWLKLKDWNTNYYQGFGVTRTLILLVGV